MGKKSLFPEGSLIEVKTDEEGFKDVYFLATVIPIPAKFKGKNYKSKRKNTLYVEYLSLLADDNGSDLLREFVDLNFVRPAPPPSEIVEGFEVNDVVDAYYRDGWWIGVVKRVEEGPKFVVTFQNPPDELDFGISNLRVHWDWVDGRWVRPVHPGKVALMFDVGKNVEVSIEEENYLNAWFPAIIREIVSDGSFVVELSQKVGNEAQHLKANVDPLHIRPSPPILKDKKYVLLEKIDAFFDGGWWSGVITKELEDSRYEILIKQLQKNRELHQSKIRPHMEWKDSKWTASSQDDVIPSSDAEKQGGPICSDITTVAVPVGSSGNGKDCTEEKMPCSLNSRENQKLKEGNLEAATSLAPEQQNILATSSKVMLCVSASPISENIRINSVKQSMLGDLSSNNSYRGRRIRKQKKFEEDDPTSDSKKRRGRTQEMQVKIPEYVVGGLATGKGCSSDKRDHPSIDEEPLKPVSEQEQQSNDSAIQRIKRRGKTQELQVKSLESVVGGLTAGKASSSDKSDRPSINKEPLKPVSEQEQQSNDSMLWRMKDIPTSGSMKKRGRNEVNSPESIVEGLATGKACLSDNWDCPSIDKESLKPVSEQEQLSNDSATLRIQESKQLETEEGIHKRKRGRPRKMPIKSQQTQVTGSAQDGKIEADEMVIKDCNANEVDSSITAEMMTGIEGSLYDQESTMHGKNNGLPKLKNRPGSIMKKTHRKVSDATAVERSVNPIEKHSSKGRRRRTTYLKSAFQVQDSLDASGSKTMESNHMVNELNKVNAGVPSREFDNKPLSQWIEEIQTPNAVDGSRVSLARTAEKCVETAKMPKEIALLTDGSERQESGIQIPFSGDKVSIIQSKQLSLPFVKNAMLWSAIESMDVFQRIPQKPHFQPLQYTKESSREGLAIGLMVTFSSVVEKALRLQLNDPKSISDDILENLADLERYGFDVHAVRDRITGLLSVKDRKEKLLGQVEQLDSQIAEQNLERNHTDEEINKINEQIRNLQEKLTHAESAKEAKDRLIASSKSKLEELKESIMTVACDFEKLAATTL
ncbi:Hypothetical predicted protein [Olea europaea subsp. europaea]|uniref:Agenet domain-containing protein n=1 Tax=Olea europaea subsp. europaea TaxID=158383 RepID=A0A8S0RSD3_OLEEU|nr:Hypothetical predicted protein [Olea europaea subsp. europaea]